MRTLDPASRSITEREVSDAEWDTIVRGESWQQGECSSPRDLPKITGNCLMTSNNNMHRTTRAQGIVTVRIIQ